MLPARGLVAQALEAIRDTTRTLLAVAERHEGEYGRPVLEFGQPLLELRLGLGCADVGERVAHSLLLDVELLDLLVVVDVGLARVEARRLEPLEDRGEDHDPDEHEEGLLAALPALGLAELAVHELQDQADDPPDQDREHQQVEQAIHAVRPVEAIEDLGEPRELEVPTGFAPGQRQAAGDRRRKDGEIEEEADAAEAPHGGRALAELPQRDRPLALAVVVLLVRNGIGAAAHE